MKLNWKTLFLLTTCCTLGLMTGVRAQITPDNSLGAENSNINPDSIQGISFDRIGGGATRGANLFHSFREFNVNNGQLVYFSNPAGIANILTRVTGVNRSNILGTLGVLGNANLFLINPNGIFFGPNASLDLGGGSFFGSSANSLLFDNGFEFSATNPQAPPLLTVNIPIGLRFRDNPGNITNRSVVQDITGSTVGLQVNPGNSLALVGGNVNLEQGGSLTAAGGRIELGGLAGAGTVGLQTTDNTFRLNFPANGLSNVSLADEAQATVRSNGGGDIAVNANIFTGRNGGQLVGGIEGIATRNGGDIIVNSNDISFDGVSSNRFTSGIFNNVQENGRGNAGGIDITTKNLSFTNGSEISAITFGNGNAGNVKIQASDISFDGVGRTGFSSGIFSTVQGNAVGNGNGIDITTGTLSLTNGAIINASTFATGDAGRIKIQASDTIFASGVGSNAVTSGIRSNVQENAMGNAGGIDISTKNLSFMNGAQIIADTLSNGNAGSVKIQANDISFDGVSSNGFTSGIFSTVQGNAEGNAGGIDITTGTLSLINGAVINASTYGNGSAGSVKIQASDISLNGVGRTGFSSGIFSAVTDNAIGNAGGIDITTKTLSLTNGGVLSASTSNGNAGNVTITASDRVTFAGLGSNGFGSGVYSLVESGANGNAGNIIINAASIFLDDRAVLRTTNANNGFAGDIALNARDQVSITNNSTISSDGNLGSIFIGSASNTTGAVVPNIINIDNSTLSTTNADPNGFAGNITLNARNQVSITNSSTVSSEGNLGSIFIGSLDTTNALSVLPSRINIDNSTLNTTNSNTDFAGDITLNARDEIFIKDSTISSNGNLGQIFIGDANSFLPALVRIEGANTRLSTANNTAPNQNAGSINIAAGRVVMNLGEISSNTFGSGRAGDISVQATGLVEFVDNALFSNVLSGAQNGQAGNITIKAGSVSLLNGAQLQSRVLGQGNGGNVTIDVPDGTVQIAGTNSQGNNSAILNDVGSGARGNAGNILINARNLSLTNGAQINSSTSGIGNAGNVTINASDRVSFAGFNNGFFSGVFSTVENGAVGKGGNINISARSLSLSDGALLTTGTLTQAGNTVRSDAGNIQVNVSDDVAFRSGGQLRSDTSGQGNAGNITIEGRNGTLPVVTLDGVGLINNVQRSSGIGSTVENNPQSGQIGNGKGGDITIRARSLSVTNGGVIDASTFAQGNAGNVTINASDRVSFAGFGSNAFSSGVYSLVASGAVGNGGNINISTGSLSLSDGAVVNALTSNSGDAGNITINANTFTANGGGQVLTTTFNSGSAGNINLNVRDRITISGSDPNYNQRLEQAAQFGSPTDIVDNQGAASGIFANTAPGSTGNGGNITIQQEQNRFPTIAIADGGEVTVDSQGRGRGGEISITGNTLTLDGGIISASTASSDGGNINLRLRNFLRLRNESLISANARGQQGGNGGNITINTPFIVAFGRNNDIIANAVSGSGGRVRTNATLFGIIPRTRADLERLGVPGLNPRNLPTNDITAFSEQNSSFGDNVQVTSPDVDPSRGLVELPETVSDPTQKVAQNPCRQGIGNEFVVTGRGGLPTTPNETLNSDNVRVDLLQPVASSGNSPSATIKPATTVTATRVPAQGWIFNDKGQVVLTAYDPTNTGSQRPWRTAACPAR